MNCIDRFRQEVKSRLFAHRIFDWREEIPSELVEWWRQEQAPHTRQRVWTIELMLWFWIMAGVHRGRSFRAVTMGGWGPMCAPVAGLAENRLNDGRVGGGRSRGAFGGVRAFG